MRFNKFQLFLISILVSISPLVSGQLIKGGLDSVSLIKPKKNKFIFHYNYNGPIEISMLGNDPVIVQNDAKNPVLRDIGHGLLTIVTGIGWGSSTSVYWKTGAVINCNDALPQWNIDLFCEGKQEKDRDRVRNSDGTFDVETLTTNIYNWDKNANGAIIEGRDTIGFFLIIMNPRQDSLLKPMSDYVFSQKRIEIPFILNNKRYMQRLMFTRCDYGLIGKFRGKDFSVISNSAARKTWFFSDNDLKCVFQPDLDDISMKKKDRVMPYLLISKKIPASERKELIRLAIMSRFISSTLIL